MRRPRATPTRLAAVTTVAAAVTAACSVSHASTLSALSAPSGKPVVVGISLPLTGQFQADGLATLRGYELWAADVNAHGGLLGRPVKLTYMDDKSDPNIAEKQYRTLITRDHVDLTLAPFSSLLTIQSAQATNKLGYALAAGSAGAMLVYAQHFRTLFSTNVPVSVQMVPFADWVLGLPPGQRPKTAAYAMVNDPFADPPVLTVQGDFQKGGISTVYSNTHYPDANLSAGFNPAAKRLTADLTAAARQIAAKDPDVVVLGTVDVPSVSTFINEFKKLGFQPKILIASAGPDQGQAFLNAVGTGNADGIMVPNAWYGSFPNPLSHVMVQDYLAKYGGTAADINADVAEAYSAGEVLAYAVTNTRTVGPTRADQAKLINYLHSGVTVPTVLGPVKFNGNGENVDALHSAVIFQWQAGGSQFVPVLPPTVPDVQRPTYPKPHWTG